MITRCGMLGMLLLVLGCAATSPAPSRAHTEAARSFDPTRIGLVTTPELPCFSGRALEPGDEVMVFEDGTKPVSTWVATDKPCADEPHGRKVDESLWHRTGLVARSGATPVAIVAVGVVQRSAALSEDGIDLDGDGAAELFASCTSSEGLHLTVWSGAVGGGKRLWHGYYYLGYDTEPTCSPAETEP